MDKQKYDDMRAKPCNIDAEQLVLGSMLMNNGEAIAIIRTILKPTDFYNSDHQKLYQAILEIAQAGLPVDDLTCSQYEKLYTTTSEKLSKNYIQFLIDGTPTSANAEYYAKKVKECAVLRAIIKVANDIKLKAYDADREGISTTELIAELQQVINENDAITSIAGKIPSVYDDWSSFFVMLCAGQKSEYLGLQTGLQNLDKVTLGLRGLSVLGGIPGQGKSSLALQIGTEIAKLNDVPVVFYALEMSKWDLYVKAISRLSKLDYATLRIGSLVNGRRSQGLNTYDYERLKTATIEFMQYADKIKIIDRSICPDISLSLVRLHIQQAKKEFNVDQVFVVIDHLQIFPCDKPEYDDMKSRIDYLVSEFKAISEQLNATILLVSEKNRSSYDRQWIGSYMGSAGIEYGVDLAMLLHEENEDQADFGTYSRDRKIHLRIEKNRFGDKADILLNFIPEYSVFEEV